jgi:hypothetical protein
MRRSRSRQRFETMSLERMCVSTISRKFFQFPTLLLMTTCTLWLTMELGVVQASEEASAWSLRQATRKEDEDAWREQNKKTSPSRQPSKSNNNKSKTAGKAKPSWNKEDWLKEKEKKSKWGIMGSDLVDVFENFGNVNVSLDDFDNSRDTPFFFMIPKSGTTTLKYVMMTCLNLVTAFDIGGLAPPEADPPLPLGVVQHRHHQYIDINVSNHPGLDHAKEKGLAESAIADVLVSAFPVHVAAVFIPTNQARLFTLMRHPVERTVSEFYYVQVASWEARSFKPELLDWTLQQYIDSDLHVGNFVTRQLVGKASSFTVLDEVDVQHAKDILTQKCLVGLTHRFKESLARFQQYFGWEIKDEHQQRKDQHCISNLFSSDEEINSNHSQHRNENPHPTITEDSPEYPSLLEHDKWDMMLYEHVLALFEEQSSLFPPLKKKQGEGKNTIA